MASFTQQLSVSTGSIAYDLVGEGPLVVCLPGLGDVRGQYRRLAPLLVEAGYRNVERLREAPFPTLANEPRYKAVMVRASQ